VAGGQVGEQGVDLRLELGVDEGGGLLLRLPREGLAVGPVITVISPASTTKSTPCSAGTMVSPSR
jgi:hypothetical protein